MRYLLLCLTLLTLLSCNKQEPVQYDDLEFKDEIAYLSDGKTLFTGVSIDKWPNGTIKHKAQYKDGKLHGKSIWYFENGQVEFKTPYKNGWMHGTAYEYHENGRVEYKRKYKNNGEVSVQKFDQRGKEIDLRNRF